AVAATLGLAANAPSAPEAKPVPAPVPAKAPIKIGVSIPAADHGWTAGVVWWAKECAKLHPDVEWTIATAETPEKQVADIEALMAKKVDGLVILATESAPITPIAEEAHNRGILIVNVDRGFLKPVADIFIEGDNKAFGKKSAEFMVEKLGGKGKAKGNLIVLEGIPCTVNTDRVNAAMEVFKTEPGIKIVGQAAANWNRQKALEVTETLLTKNPKVTAIWASDDDMALGAEQALAEKGIEGVWILGGAGMKDIVKRVEELGKHLKAYEEYHTKLGTSLGTAVNQWNASGKEFKKLDKDVLRINGSGFGAGTPELLVKPDYDDGE
ncbi:MAG: substrate-binding domain-containing protein, partial [Candidatus Kapabacteria bacterium]|nr:substrate-binding domain-containing protein [Candidatus Kapabacteria bacterium]